MPLTAPGHFIVGGVEGDQGAVISRDEDKVVNKMVLSDDNWFVAMTNADAWSLDVTDSRYDNTVRYMNLLG